MADLFLQSLRRRKEISITVRGRRSGRRITLSVWFALDDGTMWLLPIKARRSQWFRNIQADPTIVIAAGERRRKVSSTPVTGRARVRPVADLFREKYRRADVASYYTGFDAAVKIVL